MKVLKTTRLFYILYTVYTLFVMSVSNYPFGYAALGLFTIWMIYFAFSLGYRSVSVPKDYPVKKVKEIRSSFPFSSVASWKGAMYIINMAICWICSIFAAQFYTGQSFSAVIQSITAQKSSYDTYQTYFRSASIASFSLEKIPYILMLTYLTTMLFFGILGIVLSGKKIRIIQFIYIISIGLSYLYFGLARGTNIEMYIVFILVAYCLINREKASTSLKKAKISSKSILAVCVIGVAMIFIFRAVVANRGVVFENIQICTEIQYNPNSVVAELFPTLTDIGLSIFGYLGFGVFSIGVTIAEIVLGSINGIISSVIPVGFELFSDKTLPEILKNMIDVGVRWIPDCVIFIGLLGIPFFIILLFFLGKIAASCRFSSMPKLLANLICVAVFIEMISIPVGNFIMNSMPNKLLILIIGLWWLKWSFSRPNEGYGNINQGRINKQPRKVRF